MLLDEIPHSLSPRTFVIGPIFLVLSLRQSARFNPNSQLRSDTPLVESYNTTTLWFVYCLDSYSHAIVTLEWDSHYFPLSGHLLVMCVCVAWCGMLTRAGDSANVCHTTMAASALSGTLFIDTVESYGSRAFLQANNAEFYVCKRQRQHKGA